MKYWIVLFLGIKIACEAYYSTCGQDDNRACPNSLNQTDFLLTMKKGGSDILSTDAYMYDFMLCEEYNYDCGYLETVEDYTTCANGIQLSMNETTLLELFNGLNQTLSDKLTPYLQSQGESAICGMRMFPLTLTAEESKLLLDLSMADVIQQLQNLYDAQRDANTTKDWADININIRTAILYTFKRDPTKLGSGTLWNNIVLNDFIAVSQQLKQEYEGTITQSRNLQESSPEKDILHSSYLIDAVSISCDKYQSINFLVDQSGSIGTANFQTYVRGFLELYINSTNDDLGMASVHFYDTVFEYYLGYGNDYDTFLTQIRNKPHNAGGTLTGNGINATVEEIKKGGFLNGVPKIMAVMTDGVSFDDVYHAAEYARSQGITMISIGVGSNVNDAQLLEIAQTSSNVISIASYDQIEAAVEFLSNYFCKQMITVQLGDEVLGNLVKVPSSPSYFRIEKSTEGQTYELDIYYEDDPNTHNEDVHESEVDPFPDKYTEKTDTEYYQFTDDSLSNTPIPLGATPRRVYFISPEHEITINVKKSIEQDANASISYIAVEGTNLGFNLSLRNCTTLDCDEERASYQTQKNETPTNPTTTIIQYTPEEDLSVFIIIGSALAVLACLSILLIFAIRRCQEEEEQKPAQLNQTENNLNEGINPVSSGIPINQHKKAPSKSSRSSVSEKSSNPESSNQGSSQS